MITATFGPKDNLGSFCDGFTESGCWRRGSESNPWRGVAWRGVAWRGVATHLPIHIVILVAQNGPV